MRRPPHPVQPRWLASLSLRDGPGGRARRGALRQRPSWSEGTKRVCPTRLITASDQSYSAHQVQPRSRKIRNRIGIGTPSNQSRMYPALPCCEDGRLATKRSYILTSTEMESDDFHHPVPWGTRKAGGSDSPVGRAREHRWDAGAW